MSKKKHPSHLHPEIAWADQIWKKTEIHFMLSQCDAIISEKTTINYENILKNEPPKHHSINNTFGIALV